MIYDRIHAGKLLAEKLEPMIRGRNCIVLAIPRGGVVVGSELAEGLHLPLDVVISKKITPPEHPEYAIGAITCDGVLYHGAEWQRFSSVPGLDEEIDKKKKEVLRQIGAYRGNAQYDLEGKTVILVDDGIATGATVFAILNWLSQSKVTEIILAVPVIPNSTYDLIKRFGVQVVAVEIPEEFSAVGQFYKKFDQVSDQTVIDILAKYRKSI